jgi:VWFA-related protein
VRRIWPLVAVLLATTVVASQTPSGGQQPTFRVGTNLVQVDAIVSASDGTPIADLTAADFELLDDGKPMPIDRVRFLGAEDYSGDPTLTPIRTHDDEEREASRDDVRLYAIVLDDYHVQRMGELRVIEPLIEFVAKLPATDLVAVYYPLDSVTDVAFSRDREPVYKAIHAFYGRLGDITPKHPVEEEHLRYPQQIPNIRRQITMSSLEGLATHLGGIKQGRKAIVWVTEAFSVPIDDVRELYQAANRANVAIYPLDPRGLSADRGVDRAPTSREVLAAMLPAREFMRTLATETGGRTSFTNDMSSLLRQVVRDSRAYYLIAYESPHPDDGKFHKVTVKVKRPRATVFARTGYWAYKRGENTTMTSTAPPPMTAAVKVAIDNLAESLRPSDDQMETRRHVIMPPEAKAGAAPSLVATPTIAILHARIIGDPVARHEFHRTDTLVVRAALTRTPAVSGRLLDRYGQPLTEVPVTVSDDACELRLPLGSVGPGDYVIELAGKAGDEAAQQYVAFRVLR